MSNRTKEEEKTRVKSSCVEDYEPAGNVLPSPVMIIANTLGSAMAFYNNEYE